MKSIKKNKILVVSLAALLFSVAFFSHQLTPQSIARSQLFEHRAITSIDDLREHFRRCTRDCEGAERELSGLMMERLRDVSNVETALLLFLRVLDANFQSMYEDYLAADNPQAMAKFLSSASSYIFTLKQDIPSSQMPSIEWEKYYEEAIDAYQGSTTVIHSYVNYKTFIGAREDEILELYKRCLAIDTDDVVCRKGYETYIEKLRQ